MTRDEYIRSEFDECWKCRHFQMYYHHSSLDRDGRHAPHYYICYCHRVFGGGYIPMKGCSGMGMCSTDDDRKLQSVGDDVAGFLLDESKWRKCDRYVERLVALSNVD